MKNIMLLVAIFATCSLVAVAGGDLSEEKPDFGQIVHLDQACPSSLLDEALPYAEGDFKKVVASGPDKYAIHCAENPESACYEYNVQEKWIRLCDGEGTMIGYVVSVESVGEYTDPETGENINVFDVTTATN